MTRPALFLACCTALAACGNPMDNVEKLSEVETAQSAGQASVAASADSSDTPIAETYEGQGGPMVQDASAPAPGGGLLGRLFGGGGVAPPENGPASRRVEPGTELPFGLVATVCGLPEAARGVPVASEGGYTVWDSAPGETGPHTFYITGLGDGCARQFTAALALAGDVGTHEVVRYSDDRPYSSTDTAYEAIKSRVCRVSHGQPCGERIDSLAGQTAFVTAYPRFGSSDRWAEILVHNGAVHAVSRRGF